MEKVDFGQVANSYARSREDIPIALMESLQLRNIIFEGKKVADIGCGTGALTRKIAMRRADIVGVEPSENLLEQAKILNRVKNFMIPYFVGAAENTGLQDSQFDMVTVMRAWHWFDREKAIREMKRILKGNGTMIVIDSGFLSGNDMVETTFEVLCKFVDGGIKPAGSKAESRQRINGFPVEWFAEWQAAGFELRDFYKLKYSVHFTRDAWLERIESISWLAGLEDAVRKQALGELSSSITAKEPFAIPHECNVCILKLVD
ncbi:class I SAM-dependent methyltransferase [Neobacillus kokaensis]|uniref:Methyltransferase type 11 domain-containing protein n=1 Tax=Neobacillus kokaensis TaxID=2759023 RepID=A0ABQ3N8X1_9BACI|nr:class I SAM-dependent methyltransferase [Neobacillus kokaensis]GHI00607.1 hypothetical protein AM1BK_41490 [Neobacillus kokaensis]